MSLIENQIFGEYEVFFNKLRFNRAISNSQVSLIVIKGEMVEYSIIFRVYSNVERISNVEAAPNLPQCDKV